MCCIYNFEKSVREKKLKEEKLKEKSKSTASAVKKQWHKYHLT